MTKHEAEAAERDRCALRGRIAQLEGKLVDKEILALPPTAEDGVVVPREPTDVLCAILCKCHSSKLTNEKRAWAKERWLQYIGAQRATTKGDHDR